jgi:hypothetical protein
VPNTYFADCIRNRTYETELRDIEKRVYEVRVQPIVVWAITEIQAVSIIRFSAKSICAIHKVDFIWQGIVSNLSRVLGSEITKIVLNLQNRLDSTDVPSGRSF